MKPREVIPRGQTVRQPFRAVGLEQDDRSLGAFEQVLFGGRHAAVSADDFEALAISAKGLP